MNKLTDVFNGFLPDNIVWEDRSYVTDLNKFSNVEKELSLVEIP